MGFKYFLSSDWYQSRYKLTQNFDKREGPYLSPANPAVVPTTNFTLSVACGVSLESRFDTEIINPH